MLENYNDIVKDESSRLIKIKDNKMDPPHSSQENRGEEFMQTDEKN